MACSLVPFYIILIDRIETQNAPEFALGEFSGVGTRNNFLLAMIDTTCSDKRTLHFLQPEFRNTGVKTQIGSEADPLVEYIAPGANGEQGTRQYSFVLWRTKQDLEFAGVPAVGENFDVAAFQEENDLKDPEAGIAMIVELGGEVDCEAREIEDVPIPEDSTPAGTGRGSQVVDDETDDDDDDEDLVGSSEPNNDFVNNGDGEDDNNLSDDAPNSNGEFSNNTDNNDGEGSLLDGSADEDTEDEAEDVTDDSDDNNSVAGSGGSADTDVEADDEAEEADTTDDNEGSSGSSDGASLPNNDFDNNGDGLDDNDLSDDAPNSNGEFSNNTENNDGTLGDDSDNDVESIGSTEGDGNDASVLDLEPLDDAASSLLISRSVLGMAGLGLVAAIFA